MMSATDDGRPYSSPRRLTAHFVFLYICPFDAGRMKNANVILVSGSSGVPKKDFFYSKGKAEEEKRKSCKSSVNLFNSNSEKDGRNVFNLFSVCFAIGNPESEPSAPHVISKAPSASINKARRKKASGRTAVVKNERCSPDPGTESPLSDAPNSPGSTSFARTPASSFGTGSTRPNSSFTPPDRFSPANFNNGSKLIMEGLHMSRNYSDFMRSLAAKYNNNNNNASSQQADFRPNNFLPLLDSRFSSYKGLLAGSGAGGASPFPHLLSSLPVGPLTPAVAAAKKDLENSKKEAAIQQPLSHLSGLMGAGSQHLPGAAAGLSAFPMMMDMSSTQALLNIVRSASAQNAQQLESYLRGAATTNTTTKRSADAAGLSSPLDLSASMVKRPSPYLLDPPAAPTKSPIQYSPTGKKSPSSRSTPTEAKRVTTPSSRPPPTSISCRLPCAADSCTPAAVQVRGWSVSDVVDFVKSIDLCAEYAQVSLTAPFFRLKSIKKLCIDGD